MSVAIYRKYRSQTFQDLQGQESIKTVLTEGLRSGKIAHAYLFSGPRGTGKTSTARLLAKALNDPNFASKGDIDPESDISRKIEQGTFIDLVEIDAASNRGIEEIRELRDKVHFLPVEGAKKVYIIDEAHMLTREAFNALLKTLEEPPSHVVFILATTEPHKIPITITSRLQKFNFRLASYEELKSKISLIANAEGVIIEEDALELLYKQSGGSFRDAESLLGKLINNVGTRQINAELMYDLLGLTNEQRLAELVAAIEQQDLVVGLDLIDAIEAEGKDLGILLVQLVEYLRQIVVEQAREGKSDSSKVRILRTLVEWQVKLKNYSDSKLLLQMLLINLIGNVSQEPVKKVTQKAQPQVTPSSTIKSAGEKGTWQAVLDWVKPQSMQIWMGLKIADVKVVGEKVEIGIKHQSMLKQIVGSSLKGAIVKKCQEVFEKSEIDFILASSESDSPKEQSPAEKDLSGSEGNRNIVEALL